MSGTLAPWHPGTLEPWNLGVSSVEGGLVAGRLSGKTAVVTAAGQGIGRASAEAFAREGARVIATDRDPSLLASFSAGEARRLDVTDPAAILALAAGVGPIDVLFNCAGIVASGNILECSEEDWHASFALNVTAMFRI